MILGCRGHTALPIRGAMAGTSPARVLWVGVAALVLRGGSWGAVWQRHVRIAPASILRRGLPRLPAARTSAVTESGRVGAQARSSRHARAPAQNYCLLWLRLPLHANLGSQGRLEGPGPCSCACFCTGTTINSLYGGEVITNTRRPHCPDRIACIYIHAHTTHVHTYALPVHMYHLTVGQLPCPLRKSLHSNGYLHTYPIAGLAHRMATNLHCSRA